MENTNDIETDESLNGVLQVNLKDAKIELKKRNVFLKLLGFKDTEVTVEAVNQMQFLQKIAEVLKDLGYTNVVELRINDKQVYYDTDCTPNDLDKAIIAALEEEPSEAYHIEMEMDTNDDECTELTVNMYGKHKKEDMPLTIEVDMCKTKEDITKLLETIKQKLNEKFGEVQGTIEVQEPSEVESEYESENDSEEENETEDEETDEDEQESGAKASFMSFFKSKSG